MTSSRSTARVALALMLALCPAVAWAHNAMLVVSRDSSATRKLAVNGPSDILDGRTMITLLPGDASFQGKWVIDAPGISTLAFDGQIRGRRRLAASHQVALELMRADRGFALIDPATFQVALARPGQRFRFARDPRGDFVIQMMARADHAGSYRATLRFVDESGGCAPSDPFALTFRTVATRDEGAPSSTPTSYHDAVRSAILALSDAETELANGYASRVGEPAQRLENLAYVVPTLARWRDAGVTAAARAEVDSAGVRLGRAASTAHRAADLGDAPGAGAALANARVALGTLTDAAPHSYACMMNDEPGKTYPAPGRCPKCGMPLMDTFAHLDHAPRHGGAFFMSPDMRHHLEIVRSGGRELRVYLYDEFTKPIAADSARARVEVAGVGARTIALAPEPAKAYLTGTVSDLARRDVTVVVTFRGAAGEQFYPVTAARH